MPLPRYKKPIAPEHRPGPKPRPRRIRYDRLMTPGEIHKALNDSRVLPIETVTVDVILPHLRRHVARNGGTVRFARKVGVSPSTISEALSRRRNGIGKKLATYLGLRPVRLFVQAYDIIDPRRLTWTPDKLLSDE